MSSFTLPSFLQQEQQQILPLQQQHKIAAQQHWDNLTKPQGSLGRLEPMGTQLYCIQQGKMPLASRPARMFTIAADHGVVAEGVASMTSDITRQMVLNFTIGGAAINSLCKTAGVDLCVVDVGVAADFPADAPIIHKKIAKGTANMAHGPAMTESQCFQALQVGIDLAKQAHAQGVRVVGLGEMGIGNTTSSTALFCAYLGFAPADITGAGAGLSSKGLAHKAAVIAQALQANSAAIAGQNPLDILAAVGGLEIAALAGLIIGAAARGMGVMVDGFIATAAFVAAWKIMPEVREYCFFSHGSAEQGHGKVLVALNETPYLDLGLRLGEGTGAALGMYLLNTATDAFNGMAQFGQTGVAKPF